jgi:hypothetical protein
MNDNLSLPDAPPIAIGDLIARLAEQQAALSRYVARRWADLDALPLARLLSVHGQNAAHLGRLLSYWYAIHGPPRDAFESAIDGALYDLGTQWGVQLVDPEVLIRDERCRPPVDLDDVIAGLLQVQERLARTLALLSEGEEDRPVARLSAVYSRNAARLGRLLRQRHELGGALPDDLAQLLSQTTPGSGSSASEGP